MVQDAEIQINLLGYRLRILGPAGAIDPLKDSLYTRCQEPPVASPDTVFQLDVRGGDYRIFPEDKQGEPLYETDSRSDLYWWLESALCDGALERVRDMLLIHGAAVEREGEAIIFLGKSYSGKSTLTMHLLRSGFRLLSDEVVLVDPETLKLRPFPRNLLVRQGALQNDSDLRELCDARWHYEDEEGEIKWMMDPAALSAGGVAEEAEVGKIFCLRRHRRWRSLLEPVGMRAAVEEMVKQAMNLKHAGEGGVEAIVRMARAGQNYRLRAPHGGAAWNLLRGHLGIPERKMARRNSAVGEIQINLLGVRLRIAGPAQEIEHLKNSLFTRCQEPIGPEPDAHIHIEVDENGYRVHRFEDGGDPLFESNDRSDFFWWLDDALFDKALERSSHLIQIHGGAVEREGKAILFFGDPYAGKSTMVLHLLHHGWRFLTDEVILIDPDTLRVKPFHRNLLIRQGALDNDPLLKARCQDHWHYEDYYGETKWLVDPAVAGAAKEPREAEVEQIYCLRRHRRWRPLLEPVGERIVIEEMFKQAFNSDWFLPKSVDALVQIVRQSQNFRMRAPHGGVAWRLLREHLGLPEEL
ncbi:hypothetical protein ACFLQ0_04265 [Nitrospinota bacterium]